MTGAPLRLVAVLAVALLVAAAGTVGRSHVAPLWFPLAGALAAAVAVLFLPRRLRPLGAVAAALLAGAAAGHVLLRAGMPRVHDLMHPWGIWAYGRAIGEGVWLPRWIPWIGAGIPLWQFYGPLNFLLALPGIVSGLSPVGAFEAELFTGHVLSSVSMLAAARMLGIGWRGATVAAVALAFAPWRLANFDYRGALGEANAFLFMPLIAAATLRLLRGPARAVGAVLVLAVSGLILTHLVSLATLAVLLAPAVLLARPRRRDLLRATLPWLLAAGLTAGWWLPAVGELQHTSVELESRDNPYLHYEEQGVPAAKLLERRGWDRQRVALPETMRRERGLEGEQMPFYAGSVLMLVGLAAVWWSRPRAAAPLGGLATGVLLGLALSTSWIAGAAAALPGVSTLQFPWRFLSPASVLAALLLGAGVDGILRGVRGDEGGRPLRRVVPAALAALLLAVVWDAAPYTGACDRIPAYRGVVHWVGDPEGARWEDSLRPYPQDWSRRTGVVRVRGIQLPPTRYDTAIDWFYPGYPQWLSPEIYRRYWRSRDPARIAAAGVEWVFEPGRAQPLRLPAQPYARLERGPGETIPLPDTSVTRKPGRISIDLGEARRTDARLVVLEQAFPGWRVRVDGGPWGRPRELRGFLAVDLSAGVSRVELSYGLGTTPRRLGLGITLLVLLACAVVLAPGLRGRLRLR